MSQKNPSPNIPPAPGESLRETADSIIVAFILAFVFRAFIIEAFVIPTGSMASTLNGAHGTMVCEKCGWEYAYGLLDDSAAARGEIIDENGVAFCPNCRHANRTSEINDEKRNYEGGDRILVLKWPYDLGGALLGPRRWDVTVFKDPSDGVTNYIKRLAGLPNEVLEIIDGDVYTVPRDQLSEAALETFDRLRRFKYLLSTRTDVDRGRLRLEELPPDVAASLDRMALHRMGVELEVPLASVLEELNGKLRIQRKSKEAQDDLWRVAYDHDFVPENPGPRQPIWAPADGASHWTVAPRKLRFEGKDAPLESIYLHAALDSFCSYNAFAWKSPNPPILTAVQPVSDLRLSFVIDYRGGNGALRAGLTKRGDLFVAELQADGTARLLRAKVGKPGELTELATKRLAPLKAGRMVELSFENLDYRVALSIDGETVLATTDAQYAPDVATLRASPPPPTAPPFIAATDLDVELSHVAAETDIYYLSFPPAKAPFGYRAWGTQDSPIELRENEYFMLGDNSAQSKDSRLWDYVGPHLLARGEEYQVGTTPGDQLIGRAFFVYWPSGVRTKVIPFLKDWGWIPNFGQMRWIR